MTILLFFVCILAVDSRLVITREEKSVSPYPFLLSLWAKHQGRNAESLGMIPSPVYKKPEVSQYGQEGHP
jgi:hypothetical protein